MPKQPWYEGGYRAYIVTYAMAKVFHDANIKNQVLDLDTIWRRQAVSDSLQRALLLAAAEAHDVITHPPAGVRNMSEWAKQQACWNGLKGRKLEYDEDFETFLTFEEAARVMQKDERKKKKEIDGIVAQAEVVNLGPVFWRQILDRGLAARKLTPRDQQVLQTCASMPRHLPNEIQSKHAIHVLEMIERKGSCPSDAALPRMVARLR